MTDVQPQPEKYQSVPPEEGKLLGALPPKLDPRHLLLLRYLDTSKSPPRKFDYESRFKNKFDKPLRDQTMGSCTITSQAEWVRRVEYPRRFGHDLYLPDDLVNQRYVDLSNRLYGGGDNGAYEVDAVKDFLETGFKYGKWRYKIDGFTAVNPLDEETLKIAISTFKVIKICFAVHANMYYSKPDDRVDWDPTSKIVGYHSMIMDGYDDDAKDFLVPQTWARKRQRYSYAFVTNAGTESFTLVDAKNIKEDPVLSKMFDLKKFNKDKAEVINTPEPSDIVIGGKWQPVQATGQPN